MNNVYLNQPQAPGISPEARRAAFNNTYAQALAAGDPRFNVKANDRAGLSRGQGQWQQAGAEAAQKLASGVADAYSQDAQAASYNANNQLAGQQSQEAYAQQLGALQQQAAYAQAMANLQRRQQSMNFASSLLGGLLK